MTVGVPVPYVAPQGSVSFSVSGHDPRSRRIDDVRDGINTDTPPRRFGPMADVVTEPTRRARPHQSKRRTARLIKDGRSYFEPFGIPWDLYTAGEVEWSDDPLSDEIGPAAITWTHRVTGAVLGLESIYAADSGEILQCEYRMRPWDYGKGQTT